MQTRDQCYSVDVYKRVTEISARSEQDRKRYGSMSHTLPILIHSAGLAQALQFVNSRRSEEKEIYTRFLKDLGGTLGEGEDVEVFLKRVRGAELGDYMFLTKQALAALLWYKRFAQSILDVEAGEKVEDKGENAQVKQ